jgi:hypothetical protein
MGAMVSATRLLLAGVSAAGLIGGILAARPAVAATGCGAGLSGPQIPIVPAAVVSAALGGGPVKLYDNAKAPPGAATKSPGLYCYWLQGSTASQGVGVTLQIGLLPDRAAARRAYLVDQPRAASVVAYTTSQLAPIRPVSGLGDAAFDTPFILRKYWIEALDGSRVISVFIGQFNGSTLTPGTARRTGLAIIHFILARSAASPSASRTPATSHPAVPTLPASAQTAPGTARGGLPRFDRAVPPPSWAVFRLPVVLQALILGVFLVALVGFPAELFNKTYEEHEAEIHRWFRGFRLPGTRRPGLSPGQQIVVFIVLAAAFTTLVDPSFDFGWTGVTLLAGFIVAIPATTFAYALPAERYQRNASAIGGRFRVIAPVLIVAILMTLMSRLINFVPGYVYGLIAGYVALKNRQLSKSQQGRSILAGATYVLGFSLLAWMIWGTYRSTADSPAGSHAAVILGAVIAQLVALGIQSLVFGLMPFRFMDGYRLRQWNPLIWAGAYALAAFWFALILIRNNHDLLARHHPPDAIAKPFVLFAVFGALSVAFWLYFRLRPEPPDESGDADNEAAPSGPANNAEPSAVQVQAEPSAVQAQEASSATSRADTLQEEPRIVSHPDGSEEGAHANRRPTG